MFEHEITFEVREDGVLYYLREEIRVLVKPKGGESQQVSVTMWREDVLLPPEKGDLDSSTFRQKLAKLAWAKFEVAADLLPEELGWIASRHVSHANKRHREVQRDHEQKKPEEFVGTQYSIENGGFVREVGGKQKISALLSGGSPYVRISNFVAEIVEEVTTDDGAEAKRHYRVRGSVEDRVNLPEVIVPASQLAGMSWVTEHWGVTANIAAGMGTKDQVREAIQLYSRGAPQRFIYGHTGFRKHGERLIYLHGAGAIGLDGVEVELQDRLASYALPYHINWHELPDAVKVSLKLLEVAPDRVTVPLLALVYLSVLSEITPPDLVLWLWGQTGSLKSTLAALALSHFGDFSEDNLPVDFTATANYIERVLFVLKDCLCVVDDWRPAVSRTDAAEQDRKAQRLLRTGGNRSGRGRLRSDTAMRHTYVPRGGAIATAEAIPEGPAFRSATSRALTVNLVREEVDLSVLSELQQRKSSLSTTMHGFISWVAERYEDLKRSIPVERREYRDKFLPQFAGTHARNPTMAAALVVGFRVFLAFAWETGAITEAERDGLLERGIKGITEACKLHAENTAGEDPASRYLDLLRSLFAGGRAYVRDAEYGCHPDDWETLGWERRENQDGDEEYTPLKSAAFVGWSDNGFIYLDSDSAYAAVAGFAARGGIPFGIPPKSLWNALKLAGVTVCAKGRNTTTKTIVGKKERVVQLRREAVLPEKDHDWR